MLDKYLPPTDSLYKFIAITGIMFIVFTFVPVYFLFELKKESIEYEKQNTIFEKEINHLFDELYKSDEPFDFTTTIESKSADEIINELKKRNEVKTDYNKRTDKYNEKVKVIERRANEVGLGDEDKKEKLEYALVDHLSQGNEKILSTHIELIKSKKLIDLNLKFIGILLLLSCCSLFVGSILAVYGFYLWYQKIQKPNDIILLQQSNEGRKKFENTKKVRKKRFF